MVSNREYIQLVDRLTEMTQNGVMRWNRYEPPTNMVDTENNINFVYTTIYNRKNIRIYEEDYKYYTDESEYYWSKRVVIEFIDESLNSVWQFPKITNSWNLLDAVRYEDAGVADFMKSILG
ncbi:hypothetical protein [Psychrobacter frigidicola]|uniref:hypothetical protein n=1 Tax=Psychrobacter frigidicola TaxID=45611 RepID=UPI001919321B|nr:hypothetical protein [Psychrobacter frigidicola]